MTTHWCECIKVQNVLCLQRATVLLEVEIGEGDEAPFHGFCDYHAGMVAGMLVSTDEKERTHDQ